MQKIRLKKDTQKKTRKKDTKKDAKKRPRRPVLAGWMAGPAGWLACFKQLFLFRVKKYVESKVSTRLWIKKYYVFVPQLLWTGFYVFRDELCTSQLSSKMGEICHFWNISCSQCTKSSLLTSEICILTLMKYGHLSKLTKQ